MGLVIKKGEVAQNMLCIIDSSKSQPFALITALHILDILCVSFKILLSVLWSKNYLSITGDYIVITHQEKAKSVQSSKKDGYFEEVIFLANYIITNVLVQFKAFSETL